MSDREALAAELDFIARRPNASAPPNNVIIAAALERFGQLPAKCGTCRGTGFDLNRRSSSGTAYNCPAPYTDHSKVYPPETVKVVKRSLLSVAGEVASDGSLRCPDIDQAVVAILDALGGA